MLDSFEGNSVAADQNLIAKEQVAEVFAEFKDDEEATQVIQGWFDGLKKNGITQKYGLSENQYRGAVKTNPDQAAESDHVTEEAGNMTDRSNDVEKLERISRTGG